MARESSDDTFDYVLVGGGTAGSLLACRLAEESNVTVCVLEAGPRDRHPFIHIPAGFIKILDNPAYTWRFQSEGSPGTAGRRIPATQGRALGGSSSINGMIYNRGQSGDYDRWAQRGNRGWGSADVLPYFKRSEHRVDRDDRHRGRGGPLVVTDSNWRHPVCEAFIASAVGIGIPENPDYNAERQAGVGYMQRTIHRGQRWSASRAFLRPTETKSSVSIRTHAQATCIAFDGTRATGVRYRQGQGDVRTVRARRDVILCAGALNTPKLMQISGVGPPALLRDIGVPVVHALQGVGQNLRDHYCVRLVVAAKNVVTINEKARGLRLAAEVVRWAFGLPSILDLSPSVCHLFWKSDEALTLPDMQGVFSPASYKEGLVGVLDDYPGMTLGFYQQRPASSGFVVARSSDPFENPVVQPNYLADEGDRRALLGGLRLGRRVLNAPQLASYYDVERLPGPNVETDDELMDFSRQYGSTVYHFGGTCRMGPAHDPSAVVDDRLRVHGVQNLRVVDASIVPDLPSGNTCAPILMIAEKAADMILGRPDLPPQTWNSEIHEGHNR